MENYLFDKPQKQHGEKSVTRYETSLCHEWKWLNSKMNIKLIYKKRGEINGIDREDWLGAEKDDRN